MVGQFLRESLGPRLRHLGREVELSSELPPPEKLESISLLIADTLSLSELQGFRYQHPDAKVAIADPKLGSAEEIEVARESDVALVASLELKLALEAIGVSSLFVYWVPELDALEKVEKRASTVAYHGNKVHLMAMESTTLAAIEAFNSQQESRSRLDLECHYNIEGLGRWKNPRCLTTINHHQFSSPATWKSVGSATLGIVPNLLPTNTGIPARWRRNRVFKTREKPQDNPLLLREDDIQLRYKVNTNAARLYPFAFFNVPVLADVSASVAGFVQHGVSGFLCWDRNSWEIAIFRATRDPGHQRECAEELRNRVVPVMHPSSSVERVNQWLRERCDPSRLHV